MSPILAQLIATAGPQVIALAIDVIREVRDKNPAAITPEQWEQLRQMFAESYDERKARIKSELHQSGQLG